MIAMGVLSFASARKSLEETRIAGLEIDHRFARGFGERRVVVEAFLRRAVETLEVAHLEL